MKNHNSLSISSSLEVLSLYRSLITRLLFIIVLFSLPYFILYPMVGSFPAEDIAESIPRHSLNQTICLSNSRAEGRHDESYPQLKTSALTLNPVIKRLLNISPSIYYSERQNLIVAIDRIDESTTNTLLALSMKGLFSRADVEEFLLNANNYYQDCKPFISDVGVTEAYWSLKGTSVLHHWVHLYESSVSGSNHAQYGYFTTWLSRSLLSRFNLEGPTNFVKLSWFVMYLFGITYLIIFMCFFKERIKAASLSLIFKIFLFIHLGSFCLLLAPGFHWFRDFILLVPPIIFIKFFIKNSEFNLNLSLLRKAFGCIAFVFCYLVEPTFFIVSILCLFAAYLRNEYSLVASHFKKINKRAILISTALVLTVIAYLVFLQLGNILYVLDKLINNNSGLFNWDFRFLITGFTVSCLAVWFLIFGSKGSSYLLHSYFSFIALFSGIYFLITPDMFHFIKYMEYCIPFCFMMGVMCFDYFDSKCPLKVGKKVKLYNSLEKVLSISMILLIVYSLISTPRAWQLRIKDSLGDAYFQTKDYIINGRLIKADMSQDLFQHLNNFPDESKFDYIVSSDDKYLTFLYDRNNGFGTPDLVPWMDSQKRLKDTIQKISNQKGSTVLLDGKLLDIDPSVSIQLENSLMASINSASKLNIKARFRASELAHYLIQNCTLIGHLDRSSWQILRCD